MTELGTAANPEGWEGEADFAAEGTVGAMAVVGRGRLDLAVWPRVGRKTTATSRGVCFGRSLDLSWDCASTRG